MSTEISEFPSAPERGAPHAEHAVGARPGLSSGDDPMFGGEAGVVDVPSGAPARVGTPLAGDPRLARLSLNQRTTAGWSLREAIDGCVAAGLPAIGVWREPVAEVGLDTAVRWVRDAGLRVSSVCRGGFFTASDPDARGRPREQPRRDRGDGRARGTRARPRARRPARGRPRPRRGARPGGGRDRGPRPGRARRGRDAGDRAHEPDLRRRPRRRVDARAGPRPGRAVRARGGRRRRRHVPPVVGAEGARAGRAPARRGGSSATRCATGSRRSPRTRCWAAA